jgi:hypothetical protein
VVVKELLTHWPKYEPGGVGEDQRKP